MPSEPRTLPELTADFIRRVVAYTEEISYFGENSVGQAIAKATAEQTGMAEALYRALLRRDTLIGAQADDLTAVASEYGVSRLGPARAIALVIVRPWTTAITAITAGKLEVGDTAKFEVGDSVRVVDNSGTTETAIVEAITAGTGPNGGDEIDVGLIVQTYDPVADTVTLLLRRTIPSGTIFTSTAGVTFESLDDVTTGDSNPVLIGESTALALADKVWVEAQTPGAASNVEALTITGTSPADADIAEILNPAKAFGGTDEEQDFAIKYRTANQPQLGAITTPAMLEVLATNGNVNVLRAFGEDSDLLNTLRVRVLTRAGGGLGADERTALAEYMAERTRAGMAVEVVNVEVTAVEVTAEITLEPGYTLLEAWSSACDGLAAFLDWRKWPEASAVDEADLLAIVKAAAGVATLTTASFTPAADTEVPAASVPVFVRLTLTDLVTGDVQGAVLATSY